MNTTRRYSLILSVLFLSCANPIIKNNLEGKYSCQDCLGGRYFVFNTDGTFEYKMQLESYSKMSRGIWQAYNSSIVLNSSLKRGILNVVESRTFSDSTRIILKDNLHGDPFIGGLYINDNEYLGYNIPQDGMVSIFRPKAPLKSITVIDLHERYKYLVKDSSSNSFNFVVSYNDPIYRYFDNEIVMFRDNSTIVCDSTNFVKLTK